METKCELCGRKDADGTLETGEGHKVWACQGCAQAKLTETVEGGEAVVVHRAGMTIVTMPIMDNMMELQRQGLLMRPTMHN